MDDEYTLPPLLNDDFPRSSSPLTDQHTSDFAGYQLFESESEDSQGGYDSSGDEDTIDGDSVDARSESSSKEDEPEIEEVQTFVSVEIQEEAAYEEGDMDDEVVESVSGLSLHALNKHKLNTVVNAMKRSHCSLSQFLQIWVQEIDEDDGIQLAGNRYSGAKKRQEVLRLAMNLPSIQKHMDNKLTAIQISKELDSLIAHPGFGKFDMNKDLDHLETMDFTNCFDTIKRVAPIWHTLGTRLLQNSRAHWDSYGYDVNYKALNKTLYNITSIICHSRNPRMSSFLSSVLDLYLLGSGTKRRCISTLSGLGVCHSYHTANRLMNGLAMVARVRFSLDVSISLTNSCIESSPSSGVEWACCGSL